jgi:hypothetical protein
MFWWRTFDRMSISRRIRIKSSSFFIIAFSRIFIATFSPLTVCIASFTFPKEPLPRVLIMMNRLFGSSLIF